MASVQLGTANNRAAFFEVTGTGTQQDPYILRVGVDADIQVSGGATEENQELLLARLPSALINNRLPVDAAVSIEGGATEAKQDALIALLPSALVSGRFAVDVEFPATQAVSLATIPLPTGAATQTTLAAVLTELQAKADLAETQPVSLATIPLATGAATNSKLDEVITALSNLTFTPVGSHASDTTISAATTLTPPQGATKLLIQAFTQNVRYTLDGTDPTASLGFQLTPAMGEKQIPITGSTTVKVIEEAATGSIQYLWGN